METQKTPVRGPQRSETVSGNEAKGLKPIAAEQEKRNGRIRPEPRIPGGPVKPNA